MPVSCLLAALGYTTALPQTLAHGAAATSLNSLADHKDKHHPYNCWREALTRGALPAEEHAVQPVSAQIGKQPSVCPTWWSIHSAQPHCARDSRRSLGAPLPLVRSAPLVHHDLYSRNSCQFEGGEGPVAVSSMERPLPGKVAEDLLDSLMRCPHQSFRKCLDSGACAASSC